MKQVRIRYKYKPVKGGIELEEVKCPVCGNGINWVKPVNSWDWDGKIVLLAECWEGTSEPLRSRHLFLIRIDGLPMVEIEKVSEKGRKPSFLVISGKESPDVREASGRSRYTLTRSPRKKVIR